MSIRKTLINLTDTKLLNSSANVKKHVINLFLIYLFIFSFCLLRAGCILRLLHEMQQEYGVSVHGLRHQSISRSAHRQHRVTPAPASMSSNLICFKLSLHHPIFLPYIGCLISVLCTVNCHSIGIYIMYTCIFMYLLSLRSYFNAFIFFL